MSKTVLSILLLIAGPATGIAHGQNGGQGVRISPENAKQVRQAAQSGRRVMKILRGPGAGELTLHFRRRGVQVVDEQTLTRKRRIAKQQEPGYTVNHDGTLIRWINSESNRTTVKNVKTGKSVEFAAGKSTHFAAFSPDSSLIAIGDTVTTNPRVEGSGYSLVRVFNAATGKLVHKLDAGDKGYGAARPVFSPDGKRLAVSNRNYETRLFDVKTGRLLHELPKRMTQEIAFSPDGKTLAAGYVDGTIALWNVETGAQVHSKPSGAREVYSVDWSPRGDLLVTAGRGGVSLWDPKTLTEVHKVNDMMWVIQARFTGDGTRLLTSGSAKLPIVDFEFNVYTVDGKIIGNKPTATPKWDRPKPLASQQKRPNILFAIADDWGFPHAGAYGDPVVKTPHFDRIAREGVLFQHAFVSSPSCTPSRGAVLTGKFHWQLKAGANLWSVFPDEFKTYPEILKEKAGYFTGFEGKGWGPGRTETQGRQLAGKRYQNFKAFLSKRPKDAPFCYWLGTSDPHRPFKAGSGKAAGMDLSKIKVPACFPDSEVVRSDIADYYVEVQRFDALVGRALKTLEDAGELDNTIVVMTSDHGMPFPRSKSNLYDTGARVPLAIRFGNHIPGGRTIEDFVSLVELAPTFLDLAGLYEPQNEAADRSLWALLNNNRSGIVADRSDRRRFSVVFGKERHVPAQEAPNMGGYPSRAIRTRQFLFIRNYEPDRWPNGTPHYKKAAIPGAWYGDTDNGPTKTYMVENRDKDSTHRRLYDQAFGKRPAIELYDLRKDPDQLTNVAEVINYRAAVTLMEQGMNRALRATGDPRATGGEVPFDDYLYLGGSPKFPGYKPKQ